MDQVVQALWGLAAAVLTALAPIAYRVAHRAAERFAEEALATVQLRLGEGARRVAGEIAAELRANPEVRLATEEMIRRGTLALTTRFADTVQKRGIPAATMQGMIVGELGRLGLGVQR